MRTLSPALKRQIKAFWFLYSEITLRLHASPSSRRAAVVRGGTGRVRDAPARAGPVRARAADVLLLRGGRRAGEPRAGGRAGAGRVPNGRGARTAAVRRPGCRRRQGWSRCSPPTGRSRSREEWSRLEPVLAEEVERAQGRDPIDLLGKVRAELKVDPEERLLLRRSLHHHEVEVDAGQPAAADPQRLRLAARAGQLRRAVAPRRALPPGDDGQRPRRPAGAGRARDGRYARPPTRRGYASSSSSPSSRARPRSWPRWSG